MSPSIGGRVTDMNFNDIRLSLIGYDLLGEGRDGIRYAWKVCNYDELLESAAFIYKTKNLKGNVSGYTTSVSLGCVLRQMGCACRFCRTGMLTPYRLHLTSEEIALQNILMVLTDMDCKTHPELATMEREFAYMGQGEPGYSYPQVRKAIQITDYVMKKLGQKTYRHIFSTSGINESMEAFADDLERGKFDSRVTLHFSLHSLINRNVIMPIEKVYSYERLIPLMERISRAEGEKISLGYMLFNDFKPKNRKDVISTRIEDVSKFCHIFNPEYFRFSLCEFNNSKELGEAANYSSDEAYELLEQLKSKGYEAKLFYSYGKEKNTACGMLAGKKPDTPISEKWKRLEKEAIKLLKEYDKKDE